MAKAINNKELAEIVGTLLTAPEILGELGDQDKYRDFLEAIAQVVADYCGGDLGGLSEENEVYIYPNDSLPDEKGGVWAAYDPEEDDDFVPMGLVAAKPLRLAIANHLQSIATAALSVAETLEQK